MDDIKQTSATRGDAIGTAPRAVANPATSGGREKAGPVPVHSGMKPTMADHDLNVGRVPKTGLGVVPHAWNMQDRTGGATHDSVGKAELPASVEGCKPARRC